MDTEYRLLWSSPSSTSMLVTGALEMMPLSSRFRLHNNPAIEQSRRSTFNGTLLSFSTSCRSSVIFSLQYLTSLGALRRDWLGFFGHDVGECYHPYSSCFKMSHKATPKLAWHCDSFKHSWSTPSVLAGKDHRTAEKCWFESALAAGEHRAFLLTLQSKNFSHPKVLCYSLVSLCSSLCPLPTLCCFSLFKVASAPRRYPGLPTSDLAGKAVKCASSIIIHRLPRTWNLTFLPANSLRCWIRCKSMYDNDSLQQV